MSEGSQVSKVTLCVEILKWQSLTPPLTKGRYRAVRTAKNYCKTALISLPFDMAKVMVMAGNDHFAGHCQKCPELVVNFKNRTERRYFLILVGFVVGIAKEKVPVDFNFRYRIRAECRRTIKGKSGGERKLYLHETFKLELLELSLLQLYLQLYVRTLILYLLYMHENFKLDCLNFYFHSRKAQESRVFISSRFNYTCNSVCM